MGIFFSMSVNKICITILKDCSALTVVNTNYFIMPLYSKRLIYNMVTSKDLEQLRSVLNEKHIRKYLLDNEVTSLVQTRQIIKDAVKLYD